MPKKVLILYTSVGLGHKYIATNIGKHLSAHGFDVKLVDILEVQKGKLVNVSTKIYLWLINSVPWLWRWFYTNPLWTAMSLPFRTKVAGRNYQKTKLLIDEYNPDIVITAQTVASAVVTVLRQKGMYKNLFGITFSDFHLHRYWLYKEADFYLVNIPEQKQKMIELGYSAEKILVAGIALPEPMHFDKEQVKKKLGITTSRTILVTAGSMGFGINKGYVVRLLKRLKQQLNDFTMVLICGRYPEIYAQFADIKDDKLKIFGFYTPIDELYTIADVFVGKPGGLSTAEALKRKLPIIITHWMPGGEDLNVEYLTKNRLTLPVSNNRNRELEVVQEIVNELNSGSFKNHLKANAEAVDWLANTDTKRIADFVAKISA